MGFTFSVHPVECRRSATGVPSWRVHGRIPSSVRPWCWRQVALRFCELRALVPSSLPRWASGWSGPLCASYLRTRCRSRTWRDRSTLRAESCRFVDEFQRTASCRAETWLPRQCPGYRLWAPAPHLTRIHGTAGSSEDAVGGRLSFRLLTIRYNLDRRRTPSVQNVSNRQQK